MLPFSDRAKQWEPIALELRAIAGLGIHEKLDPFTLASQLGLEVGCSDSVLTVPDPEQRAYLSGSGKDIWSGGVYPIPREDGTLLCLLNPFQSRRRHKITLMEEVAHIYLDHEPSGVQYMADGISFRDYNPAHEEEAYGVGAAALLPWKAFFAALNTGKTIDAIATANEVAPELVQYRIKITGASNLYKSRQSARIGA